jgi:hypothetical protein
LGGEIVYFLGLRVADYLNERKLIEKIRLAEFDLGANMLDALEVLCACASDHAEYLIAFFQKEFGEITSILAGNSGNKGALHWRRWNFKLRYSNGKMIPWRDKKNG